MHAIRLGHWDSRKALLPISEAMGGLVCDKDFTLVRKNKGPTCTLGSWM